MPMRNQHASINAPLKGVMSAAAARRASMPSSSQTSSPEWFALIGGRMSWAQQCGLPGERPWGTQAHLGLGPMQWEEREERDGGTHQALPPEEQGREGLQQPAVGAVHHLRHAEQGRIDAQLRKVAGEHLAGGGRAHEQRHGHYVPRPPDQLAPHNACEAAELQVVLPERVQQRVRTTEGVVL